MEAMQLEVKTSPTEILVRNTRDGTVLAVGKHPDAHSVRRSFPSHGVYGMVVANEASYLIFVTESTERGRMHGHAVHEIKDVEIVQLRRGTHELQREMRNLRRFFRHSGMYFSTYPLHRSVSIEKDGDTDFLFNLLPLRRFFAHAGEGSTPFSVCCIQGFFGCADTETVCLRLVSRRSWRRTGARYLCRGSDSQGYVSNYVETEQIVYGTAENGRERSVAHLQVRGSIPLMWEHVLGRRYAPPIRIDSARVFGAADRILEQKYGDVLYLNLIRDTGYEKMLYDLYERELARNRKRCVHFNFSQEGGLLEGASREKFLGLVGDAVASFGFLGPETRQTGVVRTNCIDCLDRTNITQFILGSIVFAKQTAQFRADRECLYTHLKHLWHENGNMLSQQYSGSSALKTYLLSSRPQGVSGRLRDGFMSLKRYFVNRLCHGSLQTTYDILTTECEGRRIGMYRDCGTVLRHAAGLSLAVAWMVTWICTGASSPWPFFWNSLAALLTLGIAFAAFLDVFIQRPRR